LRQTGDDRVVGQGNARLDTLRRFAPIVSRFDDDRKRFLHRRIMITRLALDSLEGHVAANHHQPAAAGDVVPHRLEAIGERLEAGKRVGMNEERVGADVAEDHAVIGRERGRGAREVARGHVRRQMFHRPASRFERSAEPADTLGIFGGGEAVESLLMNAVGCPGFSRDQHARRFGHAHVSDF
jgi:hypothetical protein